MQREEQTSASHSDDSSSLQPQETISFSRKLTLIRGKGED